MEEDWILLADKSSYSFGFAQKIKDYIEKEKRKNIFLGEVEIRKFRNKEICVNVPKNLREKDVYFIHDSNKDPQTWWVELLLIKELLLNSSAKRVTFVLPDLLYSRQDRKDQPHVPISARALANSISLGLRRIITMDLHAPQIQGFYPPNVPVDNLYSFPEAVKFINKFHPQLLKNLVVVSPDTGGADRARAFKKKLENLNHQRYGFALLDKIRKNPGEIGEMILIGDVNGKNVLVVDDIIDSGNTLVKASRLLKENGVNSIMCYGTHGLFTLGTDALKQAYDLVITSNSHNQIDPEIKVVDVSPLFAEAIYRAHMGQSISELFK